MKRLKDKLEADGISNHRLARELGVSRPTVRAWIKNGLPGNAKGAATIQRYLAGQLAWDDERGFYEVEGGDVGLAMAVLRAQAEDAKRHQAEAESLMALLAEKKNEKEWTSAVGPLSLPSMDGIATMEPTFRTYRGERLVNVMPLRLYQPQAEALEAMAAKVGCTSSELLRRAVEQMTAELLSRDDASGANTMSDNKMSG